MSTGRPKKALNSFMHFMRAVRDEEKKANPDMPYGELTKKLANQWKNMTAEEKKPYTDLASKDLERYNKEMEAYNAGNQ